MAKNTGNHGSRKPLNSAPKIEERPAIIKKSAFEDEVYRRSLQGTPPTRRGAFNGVMPGLKPGIPADLNPPLVINKALMVAPKPGVPDGSRAQIARKRDDHGKFVQSGAQGQETSGEQDSDDAERKERLAAARMRDRLNPDAPRRPSEQRHTAQKAFGQPEPNPFKQQGGQADSQFGQQTQAPPQQPQQPGQPQSASNTLDTSPPADSGFGAPDQMTEEGSPGQVMGNTMAGMPIFDDPFHPGHEGFSSEDHMSASQLHEQAAQEAELAGDYIQSAIAKLRASVHAGLAQDAQSPMDRFAQQSVNGATQDPSMGGGGFGDQQKPIFQNQQANNGPLPGMVNTYTQNPVGMQSQQSPQGQPQDMPPPPSAQNGSMPELTGEGQEDQSFMDQDQSDSQDVDAEDSYDFGGDDDQSDDDQSDDDADAAPFGNETDEKADKDKGKDSTTKSLRAWLEKHK